MKRVLTLAAALLAGCATDQRALDKPSLCRDECRRGGMIIDKVDTSSYGCICKPDTFELAPEMQRLDDSIAKLDLAIKRSEEMDRRINDLIARLNADGGAQ